MNFRNITLCISLVAICMGASSCLKDAEDLRTETIYVANMIFPDDLTQPVSVQPNCSYNLRIDGTNGKLIISTSDLNLGHGNLNFTSSEMKCNILSGGGYVSGNFANGTAHISNGESVEHLNGFYTSAIYVVSAPWDPFQIRLSNPMLVMNYRTPNATVRTFSLDPFFSGKTTTYYNFGGTDKTFSTEDAIYRVNFADDMSKANVIIYNIKFAEEMPKELQGIVLKDVPVRLDRTGYVVEGSDIIPEAFEGGALTPYPNYIFNHFILHSSSTNLTEAKCEYTVGGRFRGEFSGAYCVSFQLAE